MHPYSGKESRFRSDSFPGVISSIRPVRKLGCQADKYSLPDRPSLTSFAFRPPRRVGYRNYEEWSPYQHDKALSKLFCWSTTTNRKCYDQSKRAIQYLFDRSSCQPNSSKHIKVDSHPPKLSLSPLHIIQPLQTFQKCLHQLKSRSTSGVTSTISLAIWLDTARIRSILNGQTMLRSRSPSL